MAKILMDERFMLKKQKVKNALAKVKALEVCTFSTMDALGSRRLLGLSGQSVAKAFPEAVEVDGMGHHRVDMEMLVPALVLAIQELAGGKIKGKEKADEKAEESAEDVKSEDSETADETKADKE